MDGWNKWLIKNSCKDRCLENKGSQSDPLFNTSWVYFIFVLIIYKYFYSKKSYTYV